MVCIIIHIMPEKTFGSIYFCCEYGCHSIASLVDNYILCVINAVFHAGAVLLHQN